MSEPDKVQTRVQKLGWGILLFVCALMILNGVSWFFVGPSASASYAAEIAGMSEQSFQELYPEVVVHIGRNARQVAVWWAAFGVMASLVALEGFRRGSRWAWYVTWTVVAAPVAIGLQYLVGVIAFDNVGLFSFGALALVGQLLAGPRSGRGPSTRP